jgi:D-3-phosphoglycerate dehydrogenase
MTRKVVVIGDLAQPAALTAEVLRERMGAQIDVEAFDWAFAEAALFAEAAARVERGADADVPVGWAAALREADVVITHFFPIRGHVLEVAGRLRTIGTLRHGVENIDASAARERSIEIVNNPGREAEAVSDFTVCLMIDLIRGTTRAADQVRAGDWPGAATAAPHSRNLRDATIGLVGFGYVGRLVHRKLGGFGSRILVYDPHVPPETITSEGAIASELRPLLVESDVVSLHVRLEVGTRGLIGAGELALMRKSAYLVNTARADLVDEAALISALEEGRVGGAALDVFWEEPLPTDSRLRVVPNLMMTPHLAGSTADAQRNSVVLLVGRLAGRFDQEGGPGQ